MNNQNQQTVREVNNILAFQDDAVVSSVLLKKESGNITLFAFAQDQELSEHKAPFDALVQVTEGQLEIKLAGVAHRVPAGHLLLMPADVPHALRALQPSKMILSMLKK